MIESVPGQEKVRREAVRNVFEAMVAIETESGGLREAPRERAEALCRSYGLEDLAWLYGIAREIKARIDKFKEASDSETLKEAWRPIDCSDMDMVKPLCSVAEAYGVTLIGWFNQQAFPAVSEAEAPKILEDLMRPTD